VRQSAHVLQGSALLMPGSLGRQADSEQKQGTLLIMLADS
jgi:hypothetical protein